jgi:hypothetical protein
MKMILYSSASIAENPMLGAFHSLKVSTAFLNGSMYFSKFVGSPAYEIAYILPLL